MRRKFYHSLGILTSLSGFYFLVESMSKPELDYFIAAVLIIILGQLSFIQGNQQ